MSWWMIDQRPVKREIIELISSCDPPKIKACDPAETNLYKNLDKIRELATPLNVDVKKFMALIESMLRSSNKARAVKVVNAGITPFRWGWLPRLPFTIILFPIRIIIEVADRIWDKINKYLSYF